jgi:phage gp29-like protein
MCENAMNDLIDVIFKLNFDNGQPPKFILFEESDVDKDLAERDVMLTNMGVKLSREYYKRKYFLEDNDIEETQEPVLNPAPAPAPTPQSIKLPVINPSENSDDDDGQQFAAIPDGQIIVDAALERTLKSSRELIGNLNKKVKDYINKKTDFTEAIDGLADMYPELNTDELYNKLVSIQFAADLVGRFEVRADRTKG